ncbi:unnamed protein product [Absidia cylindrospora]
MNHNDTFYDYKSALKSRYPEIEPIAQKYHGHQTTLNVKFDSVQDASGFMKAVYQETGGRRIYKAEMSFVNPRDPDKVSTDHSEQYCIIM